MRRKSVTEVMGFETLAMRNKLCGVTFSFLSRSANPKLRSQSRFPPRATATVNPGIECAVMKAEATPSMPASSCLEGVSAAERDAIPPAARRRKFLRDGDTIQMLTLHQGFPLASSSTFASSAVPSTDSSLPARWDFLHRRPAMTAPCPRSLCVLPPALSHELCCRPKSHLRKSTAPECGHGFDRGRVETLGGNADGVLDASVSVNET